MQNVHLLAPRYGRLQGLLYKDGQIAGNKIERIDDVLKRGLWRYDYSDASLTPQEVSLDNGLTFDLQRTHRLLQEKKAFMEKRHKSMTWLVEADNEERIKEEDWKTRKPAPVAKNAKGKAPPRKK